MYVQYIHIGLGESPQMKLLLIWRFGCKSLCTYVCTFNPTNVYLLPSSSDKTMFCQPSRDYKEIVDQCQEFSEKIPSKEFISTRCIHFLIKICVNTCLLANIGGCIYFIYLKLNNAKYINKKSEQFRALAVFYYYNYKWCYILTRTLLEEKLQKPTGLIGGRLSCYLSWGRL